ncbi:hypothetical protein HD553DRAFT_296451 [Filobasidium floriforme]|uniref:uncharacterized protein n=1 Tax=Filobasidium floriforme TaxID=5210 RepID=UPI001E8DB31D|nr:uncharacterized protein HD553DRAFT_296451 [Filobasidium floriforme]KAH8084036.1 hypothetical protein HD553DRAFT_296451 [Filobasidium floriforme]
MPIHGIAALLEGRVNYGYAVTAVILVVLAATLKAWSGGRKNTWERDWAGKMILVIADPNPITLELLHQLLHLPSPPQILYLPPLPSPLPESLLTIVQTLRLSATTKSPAAQLHCEAFPRTPGAVRAFVKQWAVNPAGTGEGGRRLDAIVWGDGWELDAALAGFQTSPATNTKDNEDESKEDGWTVQESKFHFLTAMLPLLLKAPMERSIRLINLVSPFYAAAIPTYQNNNDHTDNDQAGPASNNKNARSAIFQTGVDSWKAILLWTHLQKILDALASTVHPQVNAVPVPETELPLGTEINKVVKEAEETIRSVEEPVLDARRLPGPEDNLSLAQKEMEQKETSGRKTITVQSNILALSVVMPFNRWGVVRPMLGFRQSSNTLGMLVYLLFSPLIYLLTPSNAKSLQSVLFALQAPVLYDDELARTKGVSKGFVKHMPRSDGVRGGSIIRNCESYASHVPEHKVDELGKTVWEDLETVVEERLKAEKPQGQTQSTTSGNGKASVEPVVVPDDVYA